MSDHSSLVATFREKLRPRYYYGKSGNSRYIKENVYFNGIALKESLLHDNEYADRRVLLGHHGPAACPGDNNNRRLELEKGCFIYQNPTSRCDDNDFVHRFADMSLIGQLGGVVNSNYSTTQHALDTAETYKLVKRKEKTRPVFFFFSSCLLLAFCLLVVWGPVGFPRQFWRDRHEFSSRRS